ncbi:AraC family transcriptional regulator [Paenibacillus sp. J5C_2022]|uniref:AraC family transcriptional regulator n=1 Tax=Paenibacillus sp. J5C2022 TaxID=2977129 RepID=UPI0021D1CA8A|nr:AraC family transcriptional regulator [Paenibacillus sp. J5C2022]MCU6712582.1 AraC family transcriptional regulator [Paenibacillus sp. J5C2022]
MLKPASYGFRSNDRSILTLDSIGWQLINNPEYAFDGTLRPDTGHVIFQYTLSGRGFIEVEGQRYPLPAGTGFMVKVPSQHNYYYVEQEEPWEVIWLNMRGEEANRICDLIVAREGPVIRREADSPVIAEFWTMLNGIAEGTLTDKYQLSVRVYEWMMSMLRTSREPGTELSASTSTIVDKAKRYMKEHYAQPLTLETIAAHCGINKHYLCRLFQKSERTSPLAYLRDRRVEAAVRLLRTTEWPVQEIGKRCGFDSPSYFGKVFREYMAMTPLEYRQKKLEFPYDAIYYE